MPKGTQSYVPGARVPSRAEALTLLVRGAKGSSDTAGRSTEVRGELAPHAASILMKLLYAARIARF